jgi:uncharacterized membrane protein YccF (DUF307 family)
MRTLGNIIWHIPFLGFLSALLVFIIGDLLVLTVVASPIGLGLIQLSKFLIAPFSNEMVSKKDLGQDQNPLWKTYGIIVRIFYFPIGLVLVIASISEIVAMFTSIIGIPIAIVIAKSLSTYFNPVNKVCVPRAFADEIARKKIADRINKN